MIPRMSGRAPGIIRARIAALTERWAETARERDERRLAAERCNAQRLLAEAEADERRSHTNDADARADAAEAEVADVMKQRDACNERRLAAETSASDKIQQIYKMHERLDAAKEEISRLLDLQNAVVAAAVDAALAEVRRQGGPEYLLTEARSAGVAAGMLVLRAVDPRAP